MGAKSKHNEIMIPLSSEHLAGGEAGGGGSTYDSSAALKPNGDETDESETRTSDESWDDDKERGNWGSRLEFLLACVGYSVGLGNVWRFGYLCAKSGGGAFLIPYFICLFIVAVPLMFMEFSIGQFTQRGPIGALKKICPLFKGLIHKEEF
jgi:solute carrier family 6 GABA transporter-like protein 6/8/11/12/13